MRIAQILYNKAHWIFEADEMPSWPPDPEGNPIILVDITDKLEIQEGWDYNAETGEFTEPLLPEPGPAFAPELTEEEKYKYQNNVNQEYLILLEEIKHL